MLNKIALMVLALFVLVMGTFTANAEELFWRNNGAGLTARAMVLDYDATNQCYNFVKNGTTFYTLPVSMTEVIAGHKDAIEDANASDAFKEGRSLVD